MSILSLIFLSLFHPHQANAGSHLAPHVDLSTEDQ